MKNFMCKAAGLVCIALAMCSAAWADGVAINITNFPDSHFRSYVKNSTRTAITFLVQKNVLLLRILR